MQPENNILCTVTANHEFMGIDFTINPKRSILEYAM